MNYGFVIDNRSCIGCHACTVACKAEHDVPIGVNRTWVKYVEKGQFPDTRRVFSVMRCNHCEYAPCVDICPTQALYLRPDGIVDFSNDRCIGCKSCTQACPYDAIYIDPESHTAAKCNYCAHRVDVGLEPACVNVCPTEAIISGDLDQKGSKIANLISRQQVTTRKPEKGTRPKLFYVEGDDVSLKPLETEQSSKSLWGSQSVGVGHFTGKESSYSLGFESSNSNSRKFNNYSGKNSLQKLVPGKGGLSGGARPAKRVYDSPSKGILWGWEVAGYILTKALSAGILGLPLLLNEFGLINLTSQIIWITSLLSLIFLGATGILLIMDLDQPTRFLYVLLRPHWKSWLVKGGYTISAFGGLVTLLGGAHFLGYGEWVNWLTWPILMFSILLSIYTAFLFAQAKGRDFWQSPLLILHMLLHAVVGGSALILILGLFWEPLHSMIPYIKNILIGGLVVQILSLAAELITPHPTVDSIRTVKIITKGVFKSEFWGGVVLIGSLIPFLMLISSFAPFILAFAGLFVLIGIWCSVRIWVIAPQMIPLS
ncbi:MAG: 4Fe-4S ferredoxin [Deltaproteobacteria bacterium]|nr:4Fe-4S ferredoxin [Deltaproteobacteria bacterium]